MKKYKDILEGLFTRKKPTTAKELALKNNAPKRIVDTRTSTDEPRNSERRTAKADRQERQDWKFEHYEKFIGKMKVLRQEHGIEG